MLTGTQLLHRITNKSPRYLLVEGGFVQPRLGAATSGLVFYRNIRAATLDYFFLEKNASK